LEFLGAAPFEHQLASGEVPAHTWQALRLKKAFFPLVLSFPHFVPSFEGHG